MRKILRKLKCEECINIISSDNVGNSCLISIKDKGGLLWPSKGVFKICKLCEQIFKEYCIRTSENFSASNIMEIFIIRLLRVCVQNKIFVEVDHFETIDINNCHYILLIKTIGCQYFSIRINAYAKSFSQKLNLNTMRQSFNKLILFKGH